MLLNEDELADLWARYMADRDIDDLDLLVRQYAPLAGFFARRALAKAPAHQDPDDILSYAHMGLISAIQRFDPTQGAKFETYATRRIPGAIIDGQRSQDPLARNTRRKVKLMAAAIDQLWERMDRDPTLEEIAEALGSDVDDVRATLLAQKSLTGSLDAETDTIETRGVESDADLSSQLSDIRNHVAERLSKISGRALAFVLLYYVDDLNLKQTSESLGIKADWCRATRNHVLDSIRA